MANYLLLSPRSHYYKLVTTIREVFTKAEKVLLSNALFIHNRPRLLNEAEMADSIIFNVSF